MRMRMDRDALGLGLFVAGMLAAALLVPELSTDLLGQPTFWGVIGGGLVLIVVIIVRSQGRRGTRLERTGLALFLLLMPAVYLASWLRSGSGDAAWLWVELGGQLLFGTIAVLAWRRSPLLLGAGIAAHALLWDAWHFGRTPFTPDWYAIACAVADIGAGAYVAAQAAVWRRSPDESAEG